MYWCTTYTVSLSLSTKCGAVEEEWLPYDGPLGACSRKTSVVHVITIMRIGFNPSTIAAEVIGLVDEAELYLIQLRRKA